MQVQKFSPNPVWIAAILFVIVVAALAFTSPSTGLTWDEPTYIVASESYISWFGKLAAHPGEALSGQGVQEYWEFNHEHPPFDKVWSGLVWAGSHHILDDLTAHRLGNIILSGLLIALVYLMVAKDYGQIAGLAAVGALLTMPRFFFHAHLAALDVPVSVMIFGVGFVFWQTKDRPGWIWTVLLGLVWGLALGTKINALFIPAIVLPLWTILFHREKLFLLRRLFAAGAIGVLVSVAIWPWLYTDPFQRYKDFLSFMTLHHDEVLQYYFGQLYSPPHWHFPFVITLLVVPFSLTILYFLGALRAVLHWRTQTLAWFFILGGLIPIVILATGKSQVFDNERLLMPAFPYLAALTGVGFDWLLTGLHKLPGFIDHRTIERATCVILAIIVFLPHSLVAARIYPHLLSYYSEAVGGLAGASRLGFETTYWCESYADSLNFINQYAPRRSIVWGECRDVLFYYQLDGRLRSDIRVAGGMTRRSVFEGQIANPASFQEADFAVIEYRQSGFNRLMREWLSNRQPVYEREYQNVRLIGIFSH